MCCLSKVWWLSSCCKSSRSTDNYAGENSAVYLFNQTLARITVRSGKQSSPELQRLQFPMTLAWTSTAHKVLGLTLNEVVVSAMLCH